MTMTTQQPNLEPTPKPNKPMTSKSTKPILRPKQAQEKESQLDQLQELLNELRRQEQVLQEREEKLNMREQELLAREKELAQEKPILRPKKSLEVQPTSSVPKTSATVEGPKLKKRLTTSEAESPTSTQQSTKTSSHVQLASGTSIPIPIPAFIPEPATLSPFAAHTTTQTYQSSIPPTTSTFEASEQKAVLPFSFARPPVIPFSPSAPAPLAHSSSTASVPASKPSKTQPSKLKKKKKDISPLKEPGAWLKEHRRGLLTWFAATVGAATLTNYFAYLGREAVANKFAKEANILQSQSIAINADPNRPLRDKLFAEDPCRTGHAYSKIVKQYPAFVRQTPTRQLQVLALDPKIRANINRLALGQKPVTTGVCHLFE
jgi:hypothetical protein